MAKVKAKSNKSKKKFIKKNKPRFLTEGRIYINATFNNTMITVTDNEGNVVKWVSSGLLGFKGTRKSTPYAAITTVERGVEEAIKMGLRKVRIFTKGPGAGREAALKVLRAKRELDILSISDVTPIPHNGPRPPKMRRG